MRYPAERDLIANTVGRLYRWGMLDSTGGAVSCRAPDGTILITSSGTSFRSWEMTASDVIALTPDGAVVDRTSRPAASGTQLHLAIYEHFPAAGGVVHAHAPQSLAFASLGVGVPAVTNQLDTLGEVPCLAVDDTAIKARVRTGEREVQVPEGIVARPDVHAVTVELIPQLLATLGPRAADVQRHGLGFLIYRHGAVTLARSLYEATENLARIEVAARTARYQAQLCGGLAGIRTQPLFSDRAEVVAPR
ncbi:MAG: class II aldolase/adducin family protein [Pseudonocardiales bacterium]|nr:class II aldolase/adducin family protein [Pseudonocardiales bacterium]